MQQLPQSAAESIRMQGARSGQLGGWFENAGHDQGHDQIEFAAGLGVDEPVEMQAAQGAEDRGHVAMRAGADDIEGLLPPPRGNGWRPGRCASPFQMTPPRPRRASQSPRRWLPDRRRHPPARPPACRQRFPKMRPDSRLEGQNFIVARNPARPPSGYPPAAISQPATSGITNSALSTRSRKPPWPGSRAPESFTPAPRFMADSTRSPSWPATLASAVSSTASAMLAPTKCHR